MQIKDANGASLSITQRQQRVECGLGGAHKQMG